jgi:hypothetical protein
MVTPARTPTSSGSKPIPLSSYRLWQETLESALHGVTAHPVKTAQYSYYTVSKTHLRIFMKKIYIFI